MSKVIIEADEDLFNQWKKSFRHLEKVILYGKDHFSGIVANDMELPPDDLLQFIEDYKKFRIELMDATSTTLDKLSKSYTATMEHIRNCQ